MHAYNVNRLAKTYTKNQKNKSHQKLNTLIILEAASGWTVLNNSKQHKISFHFIFCHLKHILHLPNLLASHLHSTVWSQMDLPTHWWDWSHLILVSPIPCTAESKRRWAHDGTDLWKLQNMPRKLLLQTHYQPHCQSPAQRPGWLQ